MSTKPPEITRVRGLSNEEFLSQYAAAGRIALASGLTWLDKAICQAERLIDEDRHWGLWSHAFVFEGQRPDGHLWLIESDLQVVRKHIQLGAQENRVSKYYDTVNYTNLAVLDFGLTPEQTQAVVRAGLDLVADRSRYSIREVFGAWLALRRQELRARDNILGREKSYFCSAFVAHLFRQVGIDLTPGIHEKEALPEDIFRSPVPHSSYVLLRRRVTSATATALRRTRRRVRAIVRSRLRGQSDPP
jgi:hypothetical protein